MPATYTTRSREDSLEPTNPGLLLEDTRSISGGLSRNKAAAGLLGEVLSFETTTAEVTCDRCGAAGSVGARQLT